MAEILSTSYINSLISSYQSNETYKLITPLNSKRTKYDNLSASYSSMISSLEALKSVLSDFKKTGSESIFSIKEAVSSNTKFLTASASSSASSGSYDIRINQLAKSDTAISKDMASSGISGLSGMQSFLIKTGDGSTGNFISKIEVTLDGTETNKELMRKVKDAINNDKAVITSVYKSPSDGYAGGAGSFKINLNGTEEIITLNGGSTYEELIDEAVIKINENVPGAAAEKETDSTGNVRLKITVEDSTKYISISHDSGADIVSDLGISTENEKGASGIVTASQFSPDSTSTQMSIASKDSGLDYRITELSDSGSSTILNFIGLNLGTSRPAFDQSQTPDSAGFIYADISENNLLNSKFYFNGLNFQRNSNNISDLVEGITFNLMSAMETSDSTVNLAVSNDAGSIKSKIEDFIKKFNDAYTFIREKSTITSGERGIFVGDSNTSVILNSLKSIGYTRISGLPEGSLNLLTQIGISFDTSNGLSISDSSLLEKKIEEDISQVENLFNSEDGIANKLYNLINPYLGPEGYLTLRKNSFEDNITNIDDRITSIELRIEKSADVLRKRYEQLQMQLASLMSVSSYFSSDTSGSFF